MSPKKAPPKKKSTGRTEGSFKHITQEITDLMGAAAEEVQDARTSKSKKIAWQHLLEAERHHAIAEYLLHRLPDGPLADKIRRGLEHIGENSTSVFHALAPGR